MSIFFNLTLVDKYLTVGFGILPDCAVYSAVSSADWDGEIRVLCFAEIYHPSKIYPGIEFCKCRNLSAPYRHYFTFYWEKLVTVHLIMNYTNLTIALVLRYSTLET